MGRADADRLRVLAAEIRDEVARIDRVVAEIDRVHEVLDREPSEPLVLYGAAALLETFYTGFEKCISRVAKRFGGLPDGSGWHRALLDSMSLDVPGVRPPVLRAMSAKRMEPLLAFRHRFRNLYLFELKHGAIRRLVAEAQAAWPGTRDDLLRFAGALDQMASGVDGDGS